MTLVRVTCLNSSHKRTAPQPELFRQAPSGVVCSGTQDCRFCPPNPATVTSVSPLIVLICSGEPRKLATWFFYCPCSFVVVLRFDQDIKSNANRAQLDR